jgi:malate synthase
MPVKCRYVNPFLQEDAATAEISRAQIWQWKQHGVHTMDDGAVITTQRISKLVREEVKRCSGGEDRGKWFLAGKLVSTTRECPV